MLALVDAPERGLPRAALRFVLLVGALWIVGAAAIDPLARANVVDALVLRLAGAAAIASAAVALRRPTLPERWVWTIVAACGAVVIALDAILDVRQGGAAGGAHDVLPLAVAIALVAVAPPDWRTGARIAALWLAARLAVLGAADLLGERPALSEQLAVAAIELVALALIVSAGHRSWRLHHDLFESRRLGRFRLMSPLGHGMNEVWLAWDEQRRREVALKLLRTPGAADATRARFEREAACARLLRSPRTVRIHDYGVTDDGFAYMAFEYLRGLDVGALVAAYGPLDPPRAYHLMVEAARGLAVAHARGVVHRDVKPANLHCSDANGSEDLVHILDFGVACTIPSADPALDDAAVGTPTYMAPEAFAGGVVTAAADVYSLGASFYYALTGQTPFDGDDDAELRHAHEHAPVVPPSLRVERDIPRALENVILRCLAKAPDDRYANATEVVAALVACGAAVGPWSRELAARWWHRARVGRVPTIVPSPERTTEVEAVPIRPTPSSS
jgi:hypothetical protein